MDANAHEYKPVITTGIDVMGSILRAPRGNNDFGVVLEAEQAFFGGLPAIPKFGKCVIGLFAGFRFSQASKDTLPGGKFVGFGA